MSCRSGSSRSTSWRHRWSALPEDRRTETQRRSSIMLEQLTRHWWVLALRGVVAILFALIAFSRPGITLIALVWLWGAYAFVDGVLALVAAVRSAEQHQ